MMRELAFARLKELSMGGDILAAQHTDAGGAVANYALSIDHYGPASPSFGGYQWRRDETGYVDTESITRMH